MNTEWPVSGQNKPCTVSMGSQEKGTLNFKYFGGITQRLQLSSEELNCIIQIKQILSTF